MGSQFLLIPFFLTGQTTNIYKTSSGARARTMGHLVCICGVYLSLGLLDQINSPITIFGSIIKPSTVRGVFRGGAKGARAPSPYLNAEYAPVHSSFLKSLRKTFDKIVSLLFIFKPLNIQPSLVICNRHFTFTRQKTSLHLQSFCSYLL